MSRLIRFEFSSEEERNEFLILNDLHLAGNTWSPQPQTIIDQSGNRVGQTDGTDVRCGLDIRADYRPCIRSTRWWYGLSTSLFGGTR